MCICVREKKNSRANHCIALLQQKLLLQPLIWCLESLSCPRVGTSETGT